MKEGTVASGAAVVNRNPQEVGGRVEARRVLSSQDVQGRVRMRVAHVQAGAGMNKDRGRWHTFTRHLL